MSPNPLPLPAFQSVLANISSCVDQDEQQLKINHSEAKQVNSSHRSVNPVESKLKRNPTDANDNSIPLDQKDSLVIANNSDATLCSVKSINHPVSNFSAAQVKFQNGSISFLHPLVNTLKDHILPNPDASNLNHPFRCQFCNQVRSSKHSLERHMSIHKKPNPCHYCGKLLKSQGRPDVLRRHLNSCKSYTKEI